VHNLLVSFDENGVMQSKDLIDGEDLERALRVQLAKAPVLDLSQPVPVKLTPRIDSVGNLPYGVIGMTLTKDGMLVQVYNPEKPAEISPLNVARISYESFYSSSRSDSICHSLYLAEWTGVGKKIVFCTSAANLVTILKYLQQAGRPNMRWD
jgi:hypothetical protein